MLGQRKTKLVCLNLLYRTRDTFAIPRFHFLIFSVVNAAIEFYNASTVIAGRKDQPAVKKQFTKTLNLTINPEEKRKIIGDTFMKVRGLQREAPYRCHQTKIFDIFLTHF